MRSNLATFAAHLRERFAVWAAAPESALPETEFNALALDLFALQFTANPAYRRLCEARGQTPDRVRDWRAIPAVPAVAFKELELTSLAPCERTRVFHSSGTTTTTPARHFHSAASLALYEAASWPWFARHLLPDRGTRPSRWLALTPPPALVPHSSLVHMLETTRLQSGMRPAQFTGEPDAVGAWSVNVDRTRAALHNAGADGEPVCLLGTAFNFVHLLEGLAQGGTRLVLPPGSVVMETGGYKGRARELPRAELHAWITRALGVPPTRIVCEYGMCELSSQAYDRVADDQCAKAGSAAPARHPTPVTRHFQFPPWCRVTILSPETGHEAAEGETGLVRVFDLANVFSVAAIQTEDLAVRRGDGFELLGRARHAAPRGCSMQAAEIATAQSPLP